MGNMIIHLEEIRFALVIYLKYGLRSGFISMISATARKKILPNLVKFLSRAKGITNMG